MSESGEDRLSHIDERGEARMVDVGEKPVTARRAKARAVVRMAPATRDRIMAGDTPKGAVLTVARIAGIQAAKRTHELIPLCHPLPIERIAVEFSWLEPATSDEASLAIDAEVRVSAKTGVEMEALTAASVAALTVYDMVKAVDRGIIIADVRLLEKEGGRSGRWTASR